MKLHFGQAGVTLLHYLSLSAYVMIEECSTDWKCTLKDCSSYIKNLDKLPVLEDPT